MQAITDADLITQIGDIAGEDVPPKLADKPLEHLRFDGDKVIDAATSNEWLVDEEGRKRLPKHNSGKGWQALDCSFDAELIQTPEGWRVKTEADQLDAAKIELKEQIDSFAADARIQVVGTDDRVKLIEYVDKAQSVEAIFTDSATPGQLAEANAEAARLGLADAKAVAAVWKLKADALRGARTIVNQMVADANQAVDDATTLEAITALKDQLLVDAQTQLQAMLAP